MIENNFPRKILVVAMLNSIHTVRWLSQFKDKKNYDIHLYNSADSEIHPLLVNDLFFSFHTGNLENIIKKIKPDIVHTLEMQHSAYLILPIRESSDKFPLWFYSCWGSDIKWFKNIPEDRLKIEKVLNYIDAMFCEDDENIKIAREVFGFSKPYLKVPGPGGYKVDEMRKLNKFIPPSKRKTIAVKGYTGWVYRPGVIFSALKACSKEIIDGGYRVVIYVPGDVDNYIDDLRSLGINVVKFEWTPKYDDIISLFSVSRINLAASLSDGIPNSMLEGMIMGAYPIQSSTNFLNFKDFIKSDNNGILVNPLDVNAYIFAIKKMLKNDKLVDLAAKKNFYLIKSKIDYSLVKKKVSDFFDRFYNHSYNNFYLIRKFYWLIFSNNLKFIKNMIKRYKFKIRDSVIRLLCLFFPFYKKIYFINERSILIDKKLNFIVNSFEDINFWKINLENKIDFLNKKVLITMDNVAKILVSNNLSDIGFNLDGNQLDLSNNKMNRIETYSFLKIERFFDEMRRYILRTNILLDIGCGIRPEVFFEPAVHICVEPFKQYRDIIKPYFPNKSHVLFIKTDALTAIRNFDDDSVDTIFMFDLIEHLEKKDGLALIKEADRVARKQIVIFTPLGFSPMFYENKNDKDAWGLNGTDVQEHKSGWTPDDFDKSWSFYICKDCHEAFLAKEKDAGKKYSALMAIKTKKFNGFPKIKGTPDFVKNLYYERMK